MEGLKGFFFFFRLRDVKYLFTRIHLKGQRQIIFFLTMDSELESTATAIIVKRRKLKNLRKRGPYG